MRKQPFIRHAHFHVDFEFAVPHHIIRATYFFFTHFFDASARVFLSSSSCNTSVYSIWSKDIGNTQKTYAAKLHTCCERTAACAARSKSS